MIFTYLVTLSVDAEDEADRLIAAPLEAPLSGLLHRQFQALYGNHWLLPSGKSRPQLVKIERVTIRKPGAP